MKHNTIRLAIRHEGAVVNAYIAQAADMSGAQLIGSISAALLDMRPALFDEFKALMTEGMTALVQRTGGTVLSMHEQAAPEHERAGHA